MNSDKLNKEKNAERFIRYIDLGSILIAYFFYNALIVCFNPLF